MGVAEEEHHARAVGSGVGTAAPDTRPPPSSGVQLLPRALLALAIGAFGIGTTEFVVMGMLPQIADGLDVSVSAVGLPISPYASGAAIGAPTLPPPGVPLTPPPTPAPPVGPF